MLKITWKNSDATNSVDHIVDDIFFDNCDSVLINHITSTSSNKNHPSRCLVTCNSDWAILDYEHPEVKTFNESNEINPGRVLITFTNTDRKEIESIKWSENSEEFYHIQHDPVWSFDDTSSNEGSKKIKEHYVRERASQLRQQKIAMAGSVCEICQIDHFTGTTINPIIDVHHQIPLNRGLRKTKLDELHILCPTCHRAIHVAMRIKGDIVTVEEFKNEYFLN